MNIDAEPVPQEMHAEVLTAGQVERVRRFAAGVGSGNMLNPSIFGPELKAINAEVEAGEDGAETIRSSLMGALASDQRYREEMLTGFFEITGDRRDDQSALIANVLQDLDSMPPANPNNTPRLQDVAHRLHLTLSNQAAQIDPMGRIEAFLTGAMAVKDGDPASNLIQTRLGSIARQQARGQAH